MLHVIHMYLCVIIYKLYKQKCDISTTPLHWETVLSLIHVLKETAFTLTPLDFSSLVVQAQLILYSVSQDGRDHVFLCDMVLPYIQGSYH